MTMRDDPALRLLEGDLRRLAEPRRGDAELRRTIREGIFADPQPARRRRRVSMRYALGLGAVAAAAAAVAVVAFVGASGSGGPDSADAAVLRLALSAVTPPANAILHVKVVGVQNGVLIAGETWQQTSPPYAARYMKGEVGSQDQFADDGRTTFQYDPRTNTIGEHPDASPPTFANPMSQIRQELASGRAQLAGTAVIGGSVLYRIDLPDGLVGYFDHNGYRPRYLDDPQSDGTVVRLRVASYEYLPMTPANRALLSVIAQHPTAHVRASARGAAGK